MERDRQVSGIQASSTGLLLFPNWDFLQDPQYLSWGSFSLQIRTCPLHLLHSVILSLFCSLVLRLPRSKMRVTTQGGAYSVPLGPGLPHWPAFLGFHVPAPVVEEISSITLSISLHHRWMLFEEKLEVSAGRWSVPHVPILALPSLQKLRSLLAKGLVLLDCPARSLLELVGMTPAFAGAPDRHAISSGFPSESWNFP